MCGWLQKVGRNRTCLAQRAVHQRVAQSSQRNCLHAAIVPLSVVGPVALALVEPPFFFRAKGVGDFNIFSQLSRS